MPIPLIVAAAGDAVASSVAARLEAVAIRPVVVSPADLVSGDVEYRSDAGATRWSVQLGDGRVLRSADMGPVLNRATWVGSVRFADREDEQYAAAERAALFSAMIAALPGPLTNAPTGASPSGPPRRDLDWLVVAARVGLPVRAFSVTAEGPRWEPVTRRLGRVVVLAGRTHGPGAPELGPAPALLADRLGCRFVQLELAATPSRPMVVADVDPLPASVDPWVTDLLAADLAEGSAAGPSPGADRGVAS